MKRIVCAMMVGLLAVGMAERAEAAPRQMQITFGGYTNRSEVLTNFPVLVVLSNNVGGNFTFADFVTTNGYDLRFYSNVTDTGAGVNYEIESWNTNAGQASYVWVQVPTIPTNGLGSIYAKWGDSANSNQLVCTTNGATWTNGFAGVWHLPDASNSTARDSTSNRYDGTVTSVTATNAMVDGAGGFNGSSSKIVIGDKDVFSSNVLTLESWIKPNSGSLGTATKGILTKRPTDEYILWLNGGKAEVRVYPGPNTLTGNTGLSAGQLYHVVGVISASSISIYLNGTSDGGPLTRTSTIPNTTDPVVIGWDNYNSARYFDGVLDEVRISTVARSSNWVWACYLNQASNTVFSNYGAMTNAAGGATTTYKLQLAFTNYTRADTLTNFPVLVVFSNGLYGTFDYSKFTAPANGGDLRFTDASETTNLDFEIESWNTDGSSFVWVRVPELTSNTTLYAKWGGADTTLPACTTNGAVWTNGYVGVWHLSEATGANNADSTMKGSVLTPANGPVQTAGKIDGSLTFDGTDDYTKGASVNLGLNGTTKLSVSFWFKSTDTSGRLVQKEISDGWNTLACLLTSGTMYFSVQNGSEYPAWTTTSAYNDGNWHYFTGIFCKNAINASDGAVYIDGVSVAATYTASGYSSGFTLAESSKPLYFGIRPVTLADPYAGILDEVRISPVNFSSNWVWACWLNQASNVFFNGYGTVQTVGGSGGAPTIQNQPVTSVTTNSATFNGALSATGGSACAVCVYWGTSTNAWANTNWFNGGAANAAWTNNTPFSTNIALSQGTTYYYTYGASNETTNVVASGPVSVTPFSLPSVTNLGAQTRRTWARLSGQVLATGGETPTCWFAWWQNGFATTTTVSMGTQSGAFSTDLSTLAAGTTYGCLVTASNSAGAATSESRNFTTLGSGQIAWYAATNGTQTACTDWSTAATNLQMVLDLAASNDTIHVAGHAFGLTNQLVWTTSYVTVRGGYAATNAADQPGPSDPTRWPTVIRRASGTTRILYVNGVTNGTLDQVTIAGGNVVGGGGGVLFDASTNFLLSGSVVQSNAFSAFVSSGAGVYVSANSAITVSNCVIRKNTGQDPNAHPSAAATGGGIYSAGTLMLRDSLILQNEVTTRGWRGGGIHINGGRAHVVNCLIDGNKALSTGSGLQIDAGTTRIENCSIVSHIGEGLRQAGGTVGVTNAIFWGNTTDTNGTMTVSYSLFGTDPLFEYGYYLAAGSPATNTGSETAANLGLQSYAKNAAGETYGPAETVNLGYHYRTGAYMAYADLYVAPAPLGDDNNNGTNAATPFKTMTKALATASDGTRIHVAAGTYSAANGEIFPLTLSEKSGVKILGTNAALTILDAAGSSARVLGLNGANNAAIEGVTLTRGSAFVNSGGGGGLLIENSVNVLLSSCTVQSNAFSGFQSAGGGIYVAAGSVATVSNCVIWKNTGNDPNAHPAASASGGGIYSAGTLTVLGTLVLQNEVTGGAHRGGGICINGGRLDAKNVLIDRNKALTGDGLQVDAGAVSLTNVTVAGNLGEGVRRAGGTVSVKDSILWGNGVDSTGGVTLAWSCYSNSTDHVNGGNNTNANPLFVDTTYYHLKSRGGNYVGGYFSGGTWANASESSPCIDAGDPTSDYSREPSPNGTRVNLGCYGNTPVASKKLPGGTVFMLR